MFLNRTFSHVVDQDKKDTMISRSEGFVTPRFLDLSKSLVAISFESLAIKEEH